MSAANPINRLHSAIRALDVEQVRQLLNAGADANAKNDRGQPPLMLAAYLGNVAIAQALLAAGADVNIRLEESEPSQDETPMLLRIAFTPDSEVVEEDIKTPLCAAIAVLNRHPGAANLLKKAGASQEGLEEIRAQEGETSDFVLPRPIQ